MPLTCFVTNWCTNVPPCYFHLHSETNVVGDLLSIRSNFDGISSQGDSEDATQALPPQLVAAAIREKLQLDDDNDQDILGMLNYITN